MTTAYGHEDNRENTDYINITTMLVHAKKFVYMFTREFSVSHFNSH